VSALQAGGLPGIRWLRLLVRSSAVILGWEPFAGKGLRFLQMTGILFPNDMAVIGLQNTTWTIPKSIRPLWPALYNIGNCCNEAF
jgi:hypothetical protein